MRASGVRNSTVSGAVYQHRGVPFDCDGDQELMLRIGVRTPRRITPFEATPTRFKRLMAALSGLRGEVYMCYFVHKSA